MYALSLISSPESEPVSLEEAKAHLRVEYDFTDDDALIEALIRAGRQYIEDLTGNLIMHQTWKLVLDSFPEGDTPIQIRKRPVTSIDSIEYIDSDGAPQTLNAFQYDVDSFLCRVSPAVDASWPATRAQVNAVEIRFTAGHQDMTDGVPGPLKQALLLLVGHYYENRENSVRGLSIAPLPLAFDALVGVNRVMNV